MFAINFKQCNISNYNTGRMGVKWIVVHYTTKVGNK